MQWQSTADFFAMGGHGFYVWGSFGACLLLMVLEPVAVRMRHRAAVTQLRQEAVARALDQQNPPT